MSNRVLIALLSSCAIALAPSSASALRLVQHPDDRWQWIDLDSIKVRGGVHYFSTAFSRSDGVSPAAEGYAMGPLQETNGVNCSTGEKLWFDGMYERWDNAGVASPALRALICGD